MVVCYASCCCTFLCSFIMSKASTTMAMTTTPPVIVVFSGMSSLSSITMVTSLKGLPATLGQHDVVLLPLLTPRHSGGVVGIATMPQQLPPSQMPIHTYPNYAMDPPQVGFFFRIEPPTILYIICLVSVLVSAFRCHAECHIHLGGSTGGVCTIATLWSLPMAGICASW